MTADSSAYASGPARYGLCSTGRRCRCFAPVVRALHRALVPPGAKPVMKISTKDWPKCYCLRAVHLSHDANPFCDRRWQLCRCIWCVPAALDPPGSWEGRQFQMASAPADFARASAPRMARTLRASRRPPPRRAARENRPHPTAGFSAVAGGDAVAPKKNVKDGFFEWRVEQRLFVFPRSTHGPRPRSMVALASAASL